MEDRRQTITASPALGRAFGDGAALGVGGLPHRDADAAAAFATAEFKIATIPSLPKRSPTEDTIAQGLEGLPGLTHGQYGSIALDPQRAAAAAEIDTDLDHDAFQGLMSWLRLASAINFDGQPVKWQFVGPVTLGAALHRAGLDRAVAFDLARRAVIARVGAIRRRIETVLPNSPQLVMLDEPALAGMMSAEFPLAPDEAIDLLSAALASVGPTATSGVHCCGGVDIASLLSAGPEVISVPARRELVDVAGYLSSFLDQGGTIAWGVIATDGPVPNTADRAWRELSDLWCSLVQRGCDAVELRRQSLVTPTCGLSNHSVSVARRIARLTADVGQRVTSQATATRFALGA